MKYVTYSHKLGVELFNTERRFQPQWDEIDAAITNVSEEALIEYFEANFTGGQKSLSHSINALLKREFVEFGWAAESFIFGETEYQGSRWRLDFAKADVSIEVGFNHGGSIAWNLVKPALASQLNHVKKAIQTEVGVVICATEAMRDAGGFDNAIGTYEQYVHYLKPMQAVLNVPLVIVGLLPPETFRVAHTTINRRTTGAIERLS
jgi:hypothetical protein